MKFNKIILPGFIALMAVTSCSDDAVTHGDLDEVTYPGEIELIVPQELQKLVYTDLNDVETLPLVKGETVKLQYTIGPDNITSSNVVWTSSNPEIVAVDEEGNITAVSGEGVGYSIVQVAPDPFYASSGISSSIKVTVSDQVIPATAVNISSDADEVYAGETLQMSVTIIPDNSTYRTVEWTSSDESIATVDVKGIVTGVANPKNHAPVTITAKALDGTGLSASKVIYVNQIVTPEKVDIDQTFSVDNGYNCAINEGRLNLAFTTYPADCTMSLIEWSSSDEALATVDNGVVTFNTTGEFGRFTITAKCPETGYTSSVTLNLAAGLVRELFHDENNYTWYGTNGTSTWHDGYLEIDLAPSTGKARQDFKCWAPKTYLHAGEYPIFAVKMEDVIDKYDTVTKRNITLDANGGNCEGTGFSGGLNGTNNKWLHDYKCSDGSHVFIYSLTEQKFQNGGLLPTTSVATFNTLTFKYADIEKLPNGGTYKVYWVQTFKSISDLEKFVKDVDGVTYEVIK